jgi:hypothetical protein
VSDILFERHRDWPARLKCGVEMIPDLRNLFDMRIGIDNAEFFHDLLQPQLFLRLMQISQIGVLLGRWQWFSEHAILCLNLDVYFEPR